MKAIKCLLKTDKWQSYKEQKEEETQQVTRKKKLIIIKIKKRIYISSIQSTDLNLLPSSTHIRDTETTNYHDINDNESYKKATENILRTRNEKLSTV